MTRLAALFARLGPDPRADGSLLAAFLSDRDEAAFAELVRRHGPTVWGVCRRTLPDPADAEDAFQATFLVLLRRARGFDPSRTVGPWLYRVAVLTSRGLRRKNARRRTLPLPDVPARPEPPAVDVDALLLRLPERERAAVVLCHLHGLTQREAADRLGVPEGTLSARLSRGLAKLRRHGPLATLTAAVPTTVAEAAVTVATAGRAAGPGVGPLVSEVLRMFWLKKLATAGLAVAAVGAMAVGVVLSPGPATAATGASAKKSEPPKPADPELVALRERLAAELVARVNEAEQRSDDGRPVSRRERERTRVEQLAEQIKETAALGKPAGGPASYVRVWVQSEEWQPVEVQNFNNRPWTLCPYTVEATTANGTETVLLPTLPDLRAYLTRLDRTSSVQLELNLSCESEALKQTVRLICERAGFKRIRG